MNHQGAKGTKVDMIMSQISGPDELTDRIAHQVIGAAIEVHRELGPGYLESVYEEALCHELALQKMTFRRQEPVAVVYKQHPVGQGRFDMVVEDRLLVELKAVDKLHPIHTAQVLSYLKAIRLHLGLLLNFNAEVMRHGIKRVAL